MLRKKGKKRQKVSQPSRGSIYLLDQFQEADLKHWQQMSDELDSFRVQTFYHLEGLRNLYEDKLLNSLQQTPSISVNVDNWQCIVEYRYSLEPLSAKGSLINGGRFNIGSDINSAIFQPVPALYCAENYETAYEERFGTTHNSNQNKLSGQEFALRTTGSFSCVVLKGNIFNVFDLTKTSNLRRFVDIIKTFELTKEIEDLAKFLKIPQPWLLTKPSDLKKVFLDPNWRQIPVLHDIPANSQVFGRLLVTAGFEGILYPSTKGPNHCLAVFLHNIDGSESHLELADPTPPGTIYNRLDADTWPELI